MLDPCARVRALNAFVVEALDDMMTPDRIYARTLQATIKRYERVLMYRGDDPRKELLRSNGDKFLQQKLKDARAQLTDPVARLRGKLDTCGMSRAVAGAVEARARPPLGQNRREDDGVPAVSRRLAVDRRQGRHARSRTRPQGPRRTALRTPGSEGAHPRIPCRAPPEA